MKRVCVLLLLVVALSGCANTSTELERGMALRSKLLKAQQVCFTADISADYGNTIQLFSMQCSSDPQGNVAFTVTAPETISGITGTISEEGGKLTFDETALHFTLMTDEQLNPASAPWILMKTLRSGYLTSAGMEEDVLRLTIDDSYADDALQLDIWLDDSDFPQRAEICWDGKRILTLSIRDFQIL